MKKAVLLTILGFIFVHFSYSQNIQAFMSYSLFSSPVDGPYIETYLSVFGPSIEYVKNENGKLQGTVEVTIIFRQGENIVNFDKYEILSAEYDDTTAYTDNFLSQQRYLLPNGEYDMEFIISDKNSDVEPLLTTDPVKIEFPEEEASVSGIELIRGFEETDTPGILTKSGFDLYPYVFNFFPETVNKIMFYAELYKTDLQFGEGEKYVYSYHIKSFETNSTLNEYSRSKVAIGTAVFPILKELDIRDLPSGNYLLVLEIRDDKNEVVTNNQLFFQRSNPSIQFNTEDLAAVDTEGSFAEKIENIDTLKQFIHYLLPIGTEVDRLFIAKQMAEADIKTLQQYFLNFWMGRDMTQPEAAWDHYHQQVRKVNHLYKTPNSQGYETDRGRVFLKYGPPNIVSESYNEPAAYPYEIWQYYTLGDGQRNKKFVFYTIDIVTNDFQLVHSDAIGEAANYRWQVEIYKRTFDPYSLDREQYIDAFGSNVHRYWENPH